MIKIIAGQYKGKNFRTHPDIRPTQNIVRKSLFDTLGQDWAGVVFLDVFAGSGMIGLEALSRGAKKVVFVEKNAEVYAILRGNLEGLNAQPAADGHWPYEALQADAFVALKTFFREKKQFDVVFLDPPYGLGLAKKALKTIETHDILHANSLLVIEHENAEILPERHGRFTLFRRKRFGSSVLSYYQNS
ncbi:MAG: 16S rRNA (guanine(966)-N(2))-methyltransferase RsmD [Candidatus Omnitrophica bacterium]|nr:16S rRNA (guanine(966)-N(2))-methyltransferase RsmD [Candidatus Omnitrophota bacterium]